MAECKQMHFNRNPRGRKDGSALERATYHSTMPLYDSRLDCTFKSSCNDDFISRSKILAPEGTPEELLTQQGLWNAAEAAERKSNSVYAQEFNAGLPHELTHKQQEVMIDDFIMNHYVKRGIICDTNIHLKPTNNHFHSMMTTREVDHATESKLAKGKARDWWKIGSVQLDRVAYCKYINKHLKLAGSDVKYSHEKLEAQGIDRVPQIHVGAKAIAMHERGEHSDKFEINNNIIQFNIAAAKLKKSKAALEKAKAEEKQKADQDLSPNEKMVQQQHAYIALHSNITTKWGQRIDWFALKPTVPSVDTMERSRYQGNIKLWKETGQAIRDVVKGVISSIRTLTADYYNEHDRYIADDVDDLLGDGGGSGGSGGSGSKNNDITNNITIGL